MAGMNKGAGRQQQAGPRTRPGIFEWALEEGDPCQPRDAHE